ncbi:hypothetical protein E0703_08345 [Lactobacillus helveticus]|uniref:hypothetical protein n=1 Tax=Lactobacillus helveticus TaxID=1587 RepID=UPI00191BAB51|nr:hypothetical protein [Lactobacillus helveticus]MBW8062193.1 hypothetical protein [Lactobacillus helveticus]GFP04134.1 hypothetical protein LMG22465_01470 [Lactobacillus helveticus]
MMKCKLGWICAGIGAVSAMVASSIYFYKKDKEKREAEKNEVRPKSETLLGLLLCLNLIKNKR